MKRLAITLEDNDDSKIVCATLLASEEASITSAVLTRSGVQFEIEDVPSPLFHYRLENERSYIDLQLRTKSEITGWIKTERFEHTVQAFLDSGNSALRLDLDQPGSFVEIRLDR